MAARRVFISYRHDGDAVRAIAVHAIVGDTFERRQGDGVAVYLDTRARIGVEWPDELAKEVANTDAVLVIIGPDWLSAADAAGERRIDQTDDWVRREIEIALEHNRPIIPIAFVPATVPAATDLPNSIKRLADYRGVAVRDDYLSNDLQPVLGYINDLIVAEPDPTKSAGPEQFHLPYPDPPLTVKPAPLDDSDLRLALDKELQEWALVESPLPQDPQRTRVELSREFTFESFRVVLSFMTEIADFCDDINHHPRWENVYRTLYVNLTTWDIGHRVSHLDLLLARKFDGEYARLTEKRRKARR
jgi:pterin-4a-carbinolamine dehydratase